MATHDHHAHGAHHAHGSDKGAAFVGLFGGMVVLLVFIYGVVQWTNSLHAGPEHAAGGTAPGAEAKH